MVASFVDRISYYLISRPEINNVKDLVGKKIAASSIGGSVDMVLRLGLKDLGIDPKSVTLLPAGPPESRMAALTSGQMAATALLPEHLVAVDKAGLKILKDLSDVDVRIQHTGLVVRRSLIKENRPLVKNFLAAIVEAVDFYRAHERESIEILAKFTGIKDPKALKDSYEFHKKLFPQPPYPNRDGFRTVLAEIGDHRRQPVGLEGRIAVDECVGLILGQLGDPHADGPIGSAQPVERGVRQQMRRDAGPHRAGPPGPIPRAAGIRSRGAGWHRALGQGRGGREPDHHRRSRLRG